MKSAATAPITPVMAVGSDYAAYANFAAYAVFGAYIDYAARANVVYFYAGDVAAAADCADNAFAEVYTDPVHEPFVWGNIQYDIQNILSTGSHDALYALPLWKEEPEAWKQEFAKFKEFLNSQPMQKDGWPIWLDWYEPIVAGRPAFGLKDYKAAAELERHIALGGTDGEFHEEFWKREPAVINADVAMWVAEARAREALLLPQGSGLQFSLVDRLLRVFRGDGLAAPRTDKERIAAQMPFLRKYVERFGARVTSLEGMPLSLTDAFDDLTAVLTRPDDGISVDELYLASANLRKQIRAAATQSTIANLPLFEGDAKDLADSITHVSDLIILGTERGQKLYDDADRAESDAGFLQIVEKAENALLDVLGNHGKMLDAESLKLLRVAINLRKGAEHPHRANYFASASMQNALRAVVGVGVVAGVGYGIISSIGVTGVFAIWLLDKLTGKGIEESDLGNRTNELTKDAINKTSEIIKDAVSKDQAEFLRKFKKELRDLAGNRPSYQWLRDILDWLERSE